MSVGEWDRREVCPDGACIGVIGSDGTCKVCGRVAQNWGDERNRGLTASAEDREPEAGANGEELPEEWRTRQLCENGACIGVIGSDGRCKVCDKPDAGASARGISPDEGDETDEADEADEEYDDDEYDEEGSDDDEEPAADADDADDADDDLAARKLCPDGACIGLIGTDDRCKVCGKAAVP